MKKIIFSFLIAVETIIIFLFIIIQNKNSIVNKQDFYEFKLDNGCTGKIFFDDNDRNKLCGLSFSDIKNHHYNILLNNEQIFSISIRNNDFSTYAMKYENDTDRFIIHSDDIEGKNIIYEIKFNNNKGATIFAETNKNGFVSLSFNDDSKNNGFISFSNEMNGYFYLYNADLDFAIDNRLSEKEGFLFQRLERYENNSGFYNIKYDNGIRINELQLPNIESYE